MNRLPMTSRRNPLELRVIRSYRLDPDTAKAVEELAKDEGLSQGRMLDRIVREYEELVK